MYSCYSYKSGVYIIASDEHACICVCDYTHVYTHYCGILQLDSYAGVTQVLSQGFHLRGKGVVAVVSHFGNGFVTFQHHVWAYYTWVLYVNNTTSLS